jgi:hypothetical protein
MHMRLLPLALSALVLLAGCGEEAEAPKPLRVGDLAIEDWALPAPPGSAQPDLIVAPDGRVLLSWLNEQPGRRPAFQMAERFVDGHWEGPRTIAIGRSMVVNWADTPHIAVTADRALWAHWLQKSGDAPDAYDVMLVRSMDHGMNWSAQMRVHDDGTRTEHGFVSFWPQSETQLGVAWLDGRHAGGPAQAGDHDGHAGHGEEDAGPMSLRAAVFDGDLRISAATEIDARTCDCCQTDAAGTAEGGLLVYRDRSDDEIRDIYATRFDGKAWSTPVRVHADDWKMPACPVNGPAVAVRGHDAVVAWYTAPGDTPVVQLARSTDGGATFAAPVAVDRGAAVIGRVAVAVDAGQVWLLWMREEAGKQSLWLARYAPDLSKPLQRTKLADLQGGGRGTGFPRLALGADAAYAVWTDVADGAPALHGVRIVDATK